MQFVMPNEACQTEEMYTIHLGAMASTSTAIFRKDMSFVSSKENSFNYTKAFLLQYGTLSNNSSPN